MTFDVAGNSSRNEGHFSKLHQGVCRDRRCVHLPVFVVVLGDATQNSALKSLNLIS